MEFSSGLRRYRRRIGGGIMGFIGYLLSPLSWWDDLYINIPIAYTGAWLVSLVYKSAFLSALIFFYWVTNVAGFIMMHKGIGRVLRKGGEDNDYSRKDLFRDAGLSLAYTVLIIILVKSGLIKPLDEYVTELFRRF